MTVVTKSDLMSELTSPKPSMVQSPSMVTEVSKVKRAFKIYKNGLETLLKEQSMVLNPGVFDRLKVSKHVFIDFLLANAACDLTKVQDSKDEETKGKMRLARALSADFIDMSDLETKMRKPFPQPSLLTECEYVPANERKFEAIIAVNKSISSKWSREMVVREKSLLLLGRLIQSLMGIPLIIKVHPANRYLPMGKCG